MESIIRLVVTNRSLSLLFLLIIVVAAWIKLPDIRISQYPVVELPTLMISVVLPGASSREIEQRVISVIEEKLENLRNLDAFTSDVHNSYASIQVRYDYGVDIDDEYVDVNSKINNIKADLPEKTEVTVLKQSPVDLIVTFVLGVTSETATPSELLQVSNEISQRVRQLKSIDEVTEVYPEEEIRIELDLARVEAARLSTSDIEAAVKGNNQYLPTGTFVVGDKALSVFAFGNGYTSLEQMRDTMIINREGKALALRDVATVRKVNVENAVTASVDGRPAILLTMKLSEDANIFDTRAELEKIIDQSSIPDNIKVVWLFDAEKGVSYKLNELFTSILIGIVILSIVLLFSVGIRSGLIISTMLPAALFISVIGLSSTQYGVQEISLAGFIIALGLIVDNGIVVTENAYKLNHYGGLNHQEAAISGTSSVIMPLLSSTLTTALAFAPLYLLTSTTGLFLHSLVAVIWLCLASSLITAVILASIMIARLGTENRMPYVPSPPSFLIGLIPFRDNIYTKVLRFFISKPLVLVLLVVFLFVITGFAASTLPVIVFPDSEDPYFTVSIEAPGDRNGRFTRDLSAKVTRVVQAVPEVELCSTVTTDTFPMVNTGISRVTPRRNNAQIFCEVDFHDAERMNQMITNLNQELEQFDTSADVQASSFTVGGGAGLADIEIKLSGPRIDKVREEAIQLERYLRNAQIEGIEDITNEAQSRYFALNIEFKERRANALGVTRRSVDQVLVLITHGKEIDTYRDEDGEEFPLVLRAEADSPDPLNLFDRIYVTSKTGAQIPLSQVVEVNFTEDEYDITHEMFKPQVSIDLDVAAEYSVSQLTVEVKSMVAEYELPAGYSIEFEGEIANQEDAFGGIGKYVGIIGLIVLAIFVFQFGSVIQPLMICAAIPLSFIGAFLLLFLTGQPMSFLAFIGLTSLMGIVINNSILLVDEGNNLRDQNRDRPIADIAVEAGVGRFMPIVLTSVTSIFGLLPLALGNTMFKALAIVVIGGLSTSTFLTLICLPVLYAYLTKPKSIVKSVTHDWSGHSILGEIDESVT